MISKKRLILISVLTILLVVGGLYATYAINVFEEEVTPTEYDMAFNFDLSGSITREMTVEAGKTKVFDIDITNPYSDTIQYGVAYSLVSPTSLPSGVTIAESSISKNSAVGMIDANETLSISVVVVNESTSSVTLSFSVINGYKNGGDLIVEDGKVLVEGSYDIVPPSPALVTLTNLGLSNSIKTDTPDFSKVSYSTCDISVDTSCEATVGIYSTEDDIGTSYYFRGDVENNYVKFANSWWRIVRINGDGAIRIIYDGIVAHTNGEVSGDRKIINNAFNSNYSYNTYVGYMYGSTSASTYDGTHSNTSDSDIKTYLEDTWYATLSDADKERVADAIYCNDRSLDTSDSGYTGIGRTTTYYAPYQRLTRNITQEPKITCENKNDRFTYSEIVGGVEGNAKLEAPVGLITADEVAMAGAYKKINNNKFYLHIGHSYWTMSPYYFIKDMAAGGMFIIESNGYFSQSAMSQSYSVRPVISIKQETIKYGDGTIGNPFRLEEEI